MGFVSWFQCAIEKNCAAFLVIQTTTSIRLDFAQFKVLDFLCRTCAVCEPVYSGTSRSCQQNCNHTLTAIQESHKSRQIHWHFWITEITTTENRQKISPETCYLESGFPWFSPSFSTKKTLPRFAIRNRYCKLRTDASLGQLLSTEV